MMTDDTPSHPPQDRGGEASSGQEGPAPENRYAQAGKSHEETWLAGHLNQGEIALLWLGISAVQPPADVVPPRGRVAWRLLVTTERVQLVAFARSRKGEAEPLPCAVFDLPGDEPLRIVTQLGVARVRRGEWRWRSWLSNDDLHREASALPSLSGIERLREAARLNWVQRGRDGRNRAFAGVLLEGDRDRSDPIGQLSGSYVSLVLDGRDDPDEALAGDVAARRLRPALEALIHVEGMERRLLRWCSAWEVPPIHQLTLVEHLLELPDHRARAADVGLLLHRQAHGQLGVAAREPVQRAVLDLSLAGHLLRAELREEALELLERRLADLPDESLLDLLPNEEVDLTTEGSQVVRIKLLELLSEARGEPGAADLVAVTELARLQPLVRERVAELAQRAPGPLAERAGVLVELLSAGGMALDAPAAPPDRELHTIPAALLEGRLAHPSTAKVGTFERIGSRVAKVTIPDHGALRSYAERVIERNQPRVAAALADVALALGVSGVEAYISHGRKDLGIRAYAGSPPFVVIGRQHLDESSESYLRDAELLFALGTEVAHLRFKHTRLTSNDVWDGVFSTGKQALELVGAFSGPLGFLGSAVGGLQKLAAVQKVLRGAASFSRSAGKAVELVGFARRFQAMGKKIGLDRRKVVRDTEVGDRDTELLATCRLMQLTADRAGLVLCGDPRAAVEAIFLTSGEHRAELPLVRRYGLTRALSRRGDEGQILNQALAVRLAALFSFYLSAEYQALRAALVGDAEA